MAKPWIKLWNEMLSDPKIAKLPDWLWRRWVEFMMLAGMNDDTGILQPVDEMAWFLRVSEENVISSLEKLGKVGVVHQQTDGSWCVTNFGKRQESPAKERVERFRERKAKEAERNAEEGRYSNGYSNGYKNTTDSSSSSDSSSDSFSESLNTESYKRVVKVYESEIGSLTRTILQDLEIALEKYPEEYITAALQEAARNNKRSWSYANAICKRWMTDGFQSQNKVNGKVVKVEDKYPVFRAGDKP